MMTRIEEAMGTQRGGYGGVGDKGLCLTPGNKPVKLCA